MFLSPWKVGVPQEGERRGRRQPFILGSVFSVLFHPLSWNDTSPLDPAFLLSSGVSPSQGGCQPLAFSSRVAALRSSS